MTLSNKKLIPVITFLVTGCLSLFLGWLLDLREKEQVQREVQLTTVSIKKEIRARFEPQVLALTRMARQWEFQGGMERTEWEHHASILREQYRNFQAIEWVDPSFHVRWISPLQGNEQAQNLNLAFEENRRIALQKARDKREATATRTIDLVQGGKGFLVYVPIFSEDRFEGFILGVFQVEAFMNSILQGEYLRHVGLEVFEHQSKIYEIGNIYKQNPEWVSQTEILFYGVPWKLKLGFTSDYINLIRSWAPRLVIIFGIILSFLLSLSIHFSREARENQRQAELANKAKSEFLARMSHELRTPMNAILGYAQILKNESETLDTYQKEYVNIMLKSGYHLLDLIDEVLDIAKIERGETPLEEEELNVKTLLQEVVASLKPLAQERRISMIEDFPNEKETLIWTDRTLLKQVLINLVSNSIKYNKEGGRVWVRFTNGNASDIEIRIKDTGYGIPNDKIVTVFDPFARADNSPDKPEGAGLGLYISKKLIELMKGTISLESEMDVGSTFSIRLPVKIER